MIIDAMDLLYTRRFEGFCLVSSDSDFTRLGSRIREEGLLVYGFGEEKTPKAFVHACDKFIFTTVLLPQEAANSANKRQETQQLKANTKLVNEGKHQTGEPDAGRCRSRVGRQRLGAP